MYVSVFPEFVEVHQCMQSPWKSREGDGSLGTGDRDGCELLCGCWELNLGLLQEQQCFQLMSHLSSPGAFSFLNGSLGFLVV